MVRAPGTSRVSDVRAELDAMLAATTVGTRLPGERELAVQLGVARMTLRRVLDDLVSEGQLERRPGSGTFVARPAVAKDLGLTSFSEDMRARGLVPSTELLEFECLAASRTVARSLRMPVGDPLWKVVRLRLADGEPMAIETVMIPVAMAPSLDRERLDQSLYDVLDHRFGIRPAAATSTIAALLPGVDDATLLGISTHQACLLVEMLGVDARGRTVMLASCLYRSDRYQVRVAMTAEPRQHRRGEVAAL